MKLDIRVGEIERAEAFLKAKQAYKLWLNCGTEIGVKQSGAQITDCYEPEDLIGRQVLAVVNFPTRSLTYVGDTSFRDVFSSRGGVD